MHSEAIDWSSLTGQKINVFVVITQSTKVNTQGARKYLMSNLLGRHPNTGYPYPPDCRAFDKRIFCFRGYHKLEERKDKLALLTGNIDKAISFVTIDADNNYIQGAEIFFRELGLSQVKLFGIKAASPLSTSSSGALLAPPGSFPPPPPLLIFLIAFRTSILLLHSILFLQCELILRYYSSLCGFPGHLGST